MSKKRVSYQNLLKQAIAEYDTSTHLQVKGPMLDPIIGWEGDGELPTYKDAASILERYYYNQDSDKGVEVSEADYENDKGEDGKGMEHGEGAGTEQAGTDDAGTVEGGLKSKEKMIAKEQEGEENGDEEEENGEEEGEEEMEEAKLAEEEWDDKDVPPAKKYDEENMTTEDIENAVIEKLIAEMEEEDEEDEKDEKDEEGEEEMEEAEVMSYTGEGPKEEAPKEKVSKDPEEHTTGAGTEQAGTGDAEGEVPDRKDVADDMVKPKNYNEQEEAGEEDEEGEEKDEEEEELDVDEKMEESVPLKVIAQKQKDFDYDNDAVSEAFELFKEQIEEDE